jgi:hypothetical protein
MISKPPEKKTGGDVAREVARAAASVVPVAGGPIQVLVENVFQAPLEKRRQQWLAEVAGVITDLQNEIAELTPENLAKNDVFVTVALNAAPIALRNHQREKLDALRNAMYNSVRPGAPSEDEQVTYLSLVDQLTPWHIRLLVLLHDPAGWMTKNGVHNPGWGMGGRSTVLEHCIPELRGERDTYEPLVSDLQTRGLLQTGNILFTTMTGGGMMQRATTARGAAFIRYISRG